MISTMFSSSISLSRKRWLFFPKFSIPVALQLESFKHVNRFQLGEGMKMSNEAYMECCNKNRHLIKKAFFIINTSFSQRSQQSDLLLRVLDECETNVDKVVVMAQILGGTERKAIFSLLEAAKNEKGKE